MRRVAGLCSGLGFLFASATAVLAQLETPIQIVAPSGRALPTGTSLNQIIQSLVNIVFIVATLLVLAMLIFGAVQWILSGGDKDAVANARKRITHALIGLAILALAFFLVNLVSQLLGISIIGGSLPTLPGTTAIPLKPGT